MREQSDLVAADLGIWRRVLTLSSVQAFESFVLRCPKEITPHLEEIVSTALVFIKHDPNYAQEDEEDQMEEDGEDEEDEYSDDGDYSGFVPP
jgi:cullin-associated NEDD8-dissociated protein 1